MSTVNSKYENAKNMVASGMSVNDASKKSGLHKSQYYYYRSRDTRITPAKSVGYDTTSIARSIFALPISAQKKIAALEAILS